MKSTQAGVSVTREVEMEVTQCIKSLTELPVNLLFRAQILDI